MVNNMLLLTINGFRDAVQRFNQNSGTRLADSGTARRRGDIYRSNP